MRLNSAKGKEFHSKKKLNYQGLECPQKNDNHQSDSSHITIDELLERMQSCNPYINVHNSKGNKSS